MPDLHIHIISFDVPYPPNYGGVIDVFYKIRALHSAGVKIHLHCFLYRRDPAPELDEYCDSVHYYRRKTGFLSALGFKPYIVYSRRSPELIANLLKDGHPILFEGLHTCYYLNDRRLFGRLKIYRESNIEHRYYYHLYKAETRLWRKWYFFFSSLKLKFFQRVLAHASLILTVSREDNDYLSLHFPGIPVEYLPSFHPDNELHCREGTGKYALYHGNLGVAENYKAAEYLVNEVFSHSDHDLIIAGLDPPPHLLRLVKGRPRVRLIANPPEEELSELIREAQMNILVTFQATGLKLKLLNALFNGRYCLVNPAMVSGTALGPLCETGENADELLQKIRELSTKPFTPGIIDERRRILMQWHSNHRNCKKLIDLLSLYK